MKLYPGFSAFCLDNHLPTTVAFMPTLDRIRALVDEPGNLNVLQGLHLYALCLEFKPDLIIELGRGFGNSTCVFGSALAANGGGRLVSYDLDALWDSTTLPKLKASELAPIVPFVDARVQDIKMVDFSEVVGNARRVFVFWDAHGWEAADGVLCRLLPAIATRNHIVACHDLSDTRYVEVNREYDGRMFWRGPELKKVSARYNVGWVNSQEPQFIPLLDFLWRNKCELRSADEDLSLWRTKNPQRQEAIERAIGPGLFQPGCHWGYFSLEDAEARLTFPTQDTTPAPPSIATSREAELQAEIDALRSSTSWRITTPLRALIRTMRGY